MVLIFNFNQSMVSPLYTYQDYQLEGENNYTDLTIDAFEVILKCDGTGKRLMP